MIIRKMEDKVREEGKTESENIGKTMNWIFDKVEPRAGEGIKELEEATRNAEDGARRKEEELIIVENQRKIESEARIRAEEEAKRKEEDIIRAEEEIKRLQEKVEEDVKRKTEEEARKKSGGGVDWKDGEWVRLEEVKKKIVDDALRKAEEANKKAEDAQRRIEEVIKNQELNIDTQKKAEKEREEKERLSELRRNRRIEFFDNLKKAKELRRRRKLSNQRKKHELMLELRKAEESRLKEVRQRKSERLENKFDLIEFVDGFKYGPNSARNKKLLYGGLLAIVLLFGFISVLNRSATTGYTTVTKEFSYTDNTGLIVNRGMDYNWVMDKNGILKSLKINGRISEDGAAKVYLVGEDESYVVFDSSRLSESIGAVGLVVSDNANDTLIDEITEEGMESEPIGENLADKKIMISIFGGGSASTREILEFNAAAEFNWNVSYDKLCVKWEVNSLLAECYGSVSCCAFMDAESSGSWNDSFYLSYSRYGAVEENIISSQIVYYDVNLSVPYSDIAYSSEEHAGAEFYEPIIAFSDECIESCLLNLNSSFYRLVINVTGGFIEIDSISYNVEEEVVVSDNSSILNEAPILVKDIPDIVIEKNGRHTIDLSEYFEDDDKIVYYLPRLEDIFFANSYTDTVFIVPNLDYTGNQETFFIASDNEHTVKSNKFAITVKDGLDRIENNTVENITIENATVERINMAPYLVKEFSDISIGGEYRVDLDEYFNDPDNDSLTYSNYDVDDLIVVIDGSTAFVKGVSGFTGSKHMFFRANDSKLSITSNVFKVSVNASLVNMGSINASAVNVSDGNGSIVNESLVQMMAVINKPVKWVKTIDLDGSAGSLTVNITSSAMDVSVKKVVSGVNVSVNNVKVDDNGVVKNLSSFVAEQKIDYIDSRIDKLTDKKSGLTSLETKEINGEIVELRNERNTLTGYVVYDYNEKGIFIRFFEWLFSVEIDPTGYAVADVSLNESNSTSILIEENISSVLVEYETPGPEAVEKEISSNKKEIVVSSDVHYTDILAYTALSTEVPLNAVKIYNIKDGNRVPVSVYSSDDADNDGLVETVYWIVPHLSNETYEVEITVLNVQSYPTVGGNWTVEFNTTGEGNLIISAINNTSYGSGLPDDLTPLELRCENSSLNYTWLNNSAYYGNYSCDNLTGYWTVNVLTSGAHNQMFNFSGQMAYANNFASSNCSGGGDLTTTCYINETYYVFDEEAISANNL
ncbi:MAG: hypothetical protein KKC54_08275, partial [Nanoarchaeota archaeon]|nr:hypothetical protein [Nanoarchaeota archaeon]